MQAVSMTSEELPPVPRKHPSVTRDYEYKRLGTLSLLAGIELETHSELSAKELKAWVEGIKI